MGGRGANSLSGKSGASKAGVGAAMAAKSWEDLTAVAAANGIPLDDSLKTILLETAKTALAGTIDIANEFPQVARDMFKLGAKEHRRNVLASASLTGVINVNPAEYASQKGLEAEYARAVASGFHPSGNARAITSHEAGHILEAALLHRKYGKLTYQAIDDWNKSREAMRIVGQASRQVKKTAEGKGTKIGGQIRQVSRYATKNRSEALAECVADYISNGNSANPLSREVWGILKQELG